MKRVLRAVLCAVLLPCGGFGQGAAPARVAIISMAHPVDSRGETVYEVRGEHDGAATVVPGTLTDPKPLKTSPLKYSRAMKKAHYSGLITLEGVITASGEVIDLEPDPTGDAEANAVALAAVSKYRFVPAMLDGKPVASRFRTQAHFSLKQ